MPHSQARLSSSLFPASWSDGPLSAQRTVAGRKSRSTEEIVLGRNPARYCLPSRLTVTHVHLNHTAACCLFGYGCHGLQSDLKVMLRQCELAVRPRTISPPAFPSRHRPSPTLIELSSAGGYLLTKYLTVWVGFIRLRDQAVVKLRSPGQDRRHVLSIRLAPPHKATVTAASCSGRVGLVNLGQANGPINTREP